MCYDLVKVLSCVYILVGLLIVLDYLDEVIVLICCLVILDEVCEGLMCGDFIDDKDVFWKKFGVFVEEV